MKLLSRLSLGLIFSNISLLFAQSEGRTNYYVNDNEQTEVTLSCVDNGAQLIEENGLFLIHWLREAIDAKTGVPTGKQEKIVGVYHDPEDPLNVNLEPEKYFVNGATGELTIKGGSNDDGTFGLHDIAKYDCRIEVGKKGGTIEDEVIVMAILALPKEEEREPILLDIQPSADPETPFVYKNEFSGQLVICQAGHSNPKPSIRWEAKKDGKVIKEVLPSVGIFSDNPLIIDDDDTDERHAAELPLSLYEGDGAGLDSTFDQTSFDCIVEYDVAKDGKMVKQSYKKTFPESGFIRVMHAVSDVRLLVDQKPVTSNFIDLTYGEVQTITCDSDGYDPNSDNSHTLSPDTNDITDRLNEIMENNEQGATVDVRCEASNGLNDEPAVAEMTLTPQYIGLPDVKVEDGFRKKDPKTITVDVPASGDVEVAVYPIKNTEVPNGDPLSPLEAKKMIDEVENKETPLKENADGTYTADGPPPYYVIVKMPGTDVERVHVDGIFVRAHSEFRAGETKTELPLEGRYKINEVSDSKHPVDGLKIRFWRNIGIMEAVDFKELTATSKDEGKYDYMDAPKKESGEVYRQVPSPSGGQYVVCYDHGGADADIMATKGQSFEDAKHAIAGDQEEFCEFYNLAPQAASMWWLWIIILIILLIVIGAIVWWIRQKQNADQDDEDPKLEASQSIPGAQDATDEFSQENEQSPMIKNNDATGDTQQSSE